MTTETSISAVVVDYFTRTMTERLVRELEDDPDITEILVVDNSGDPSYHLTSLASSRTRVLKSECRQGYGAGVNFGSRFATSEYLLVLNSDIRLVSGHFSDLVSDLRSGAASLSAPRLLDRHGRGQLSSRGRFPRRWGVAGRAPGDRGSWLTGAAFMMRRDLFVALDGFDQDYFMYWEDVDLCRRLAREGRAVCVNAEVVMEHLTGASDLSQTSRYGYASASRDHFLAKWHYPLVQRLVVHLVGRVKRAWLSLDAK